MVGILQHHCVAGRWCVCSVETGERERARGAYRPSDDAVRYCPGPGLVVNSHTLVSVRDSVAW